MKNINIKSLLTGVLLASTIFLCMGAASTGQEGPERSGGIAALLYNLFCSMAPFLLIISVIWIIFSKNKKKQDRVLDKNLVHLENAEKHMERFEAQNKEIISLLKVLAGKEEEPEKSDEAEKE